MEMVEIQKTNEWTRYVGSPSAETFGCVVGPFDRVDQAAYLPAR